MKVAIEANGDSRYIQTEKGKVLFNGFWRDGDKQNVCMWLDRATWHDAKTGEGGGCKEFAKTAFNLELPEFMRLFGNPTNVSEHLEKTRKTTWPSEQKPLLKPVNHIWSEMIKLIPAETKIAAKWFEIERGFTDVQCFAENGVTCLNERHVHLFEERHQKFLRHRLTLGKQLVVPIRNVHSDRVQNLFFRTITQCDKNEKSRLLPGAGGWSEPDGSPRAFGFPHLFREFSNMVICEGMADYMAAECLLEQEEKYLPIGAANADALVKWAKWLSQSKYPGHTVLVYHLDRDQHGKYSLQGVGPLKCLEALKTFKENGLGANLFQWSKYLESITTHSNEINDLADSLKAEAVHQEHYAGHLNFCFFHCLK